MSESKPFTQECDRYPVDYVGLSVGIHGLRKGVTAEEVRLAVEDVLRECFAWTEMEGDIEVEIDEHAP